MTTNGTRYNTSTSSVQRSFDVRCINTVSTPVLLSQHLPTLVWGFTRWRPSSPPLLLTASSRAAYPLRDNRTRAHDADGRRAAVMQIVAGIVPDAHYAFNLHNKKLLSVA